MSSKTNEHFKILFLKQSQWVKITENQWLELRSFILLGPKWFRFHTVAFFAVSFRKCRVLTFFCIPGWGFWNHEYSEIAPKGKRTPVCEESLGGESTKSQEKSSNFFSSTPWKKLTAGSPQNHPLEMGTSFSKPQFWVQNINFPGCVGRIVWSKKNMFFSTLSMYRGQNGLRCDTYPAAGSQP